MKRDAGVRATNGHYAFSGLGASGCVIPPSLEDPSGLPLTPLIGPDGKRIKMFGTKILHLHFGEGNTYDQVFWLVEIESLILGVDFLTKFYFRNDVRRYLLISLDNSRIVKTQGDTDLRLLKAANRNRLPFLPNMKYHQLVRDQETSNVVCNCRAARTKFDFPTLKDVPVGQEGFMVFCDTLMGRPCQVVPPNWARLIFFVIHTPAHCNLGAPFSRISRHFFGVI